MFLLAGRHFLMFEFLFLWVLFLIHDGAKEKKRKIPSLILVLPDVLVNLAHFKQVGPEIPCVSFGPFPGACRLFCPRNCALVMHSQAACPMCIP
jgi:hypothetical protein